MVKLKVVGHWAEDEHVYNQFKTFTRTPDFRWNEIQLVGPDEAFDFLLIVNHPRHQIRVDPGRCIVMQWEPIDARRHWGDFFHPDPSLFFAVFDICTSFNIPAWQISKNWMWLKSNKIEKSKLFSGVVSDKTISPYGDMRQGRERRIRFIVGYLSRILDYEHFGRLHQPDSPISKIGNFRGSPENKEDALFPYKYTFAAENGCEENYFTEKIIDAILSECFVLYAGHPSISKHFDPDCFTLLDLTNPEGALSLVVESISGEKWEERIDKIRREKERILNEFSVFPVLEGLFRARGVLPGVTK